MLVNASTSPGPALWQGIMLIVVIFYGLYLFGGPPKSAEQAQTATVLVGLIGVLLLIAILVFL